MSLMIKCDSCDKLMDVSEAGDILIIKEVPDLMMIKIELQWDSPSNKIHYCKECFITEVVDQLRNNESIDVVCTGEL